MENSKARCSAFDKAVNLLAFKDRTTKELENKLKDKGYGLQEIEEAIDKLTYYGYLNDENYTSCYIKGNSSKKGKKLICRELESKGINKECIELAYDDMEHDEVSTIQDIFSRKFNDSDLMDDKVVRRIVGFFLRRGFNYENVISVIRRYRCTNL